MIEEEREDRKRKKSCGKVKHRDVRDEKKMEKCRKREKSENRKKGG